MSSSVVAVTGATGFVGREIVRQLLAKGHQVRALCRDRDKARATLPPDRALSVVYGSVLDPAAARALVSGVDACIHLVGIIRAKGSSTFEAMHVDATRVIVEACRTAGVRRFVHMSALGVSPDGRAEYQRTKFEGEQIVRRSGLDWTVFRPGLIHGPGGELTQMIRSWCSGSAQPFFFIPHFTRMVEHDEGVPLGRVTFESARVAPVAVGDVAACFVSALDHPVTIGEVYNVVGSESLTFKAMLEWFRDHLASADKSLPVVGVPGEIASLQATAAKVVGLGGLLPFDEGMPLMATEDSSASLEKLRQHVKVAPGAFQAQAAAYVGAM